MSCLSFAVGRDTVQELVALLFFDQIIKYRHDGLHEEAHRLGVDDALTVLEGCFDQGCTGLEDLDPLAGVGDAVDFHRAQRFQQALDLGIEFGEVLVVEIATLLGATALALGDDYLLLDDAFDLTNIEDRLEYRDCFLVVGAIGALEQASVGTISLLQGQQRVQRRQPKRREFNFHTVALFVLNHLKSTKAREGSRQFSSKVQHFTLGAEPTNFNRTLLPGPACHQAPSVFDELYTTIRNRYGDGNASQGMADWISSNTTLNNQPFKYEHYWFQKAIADDMHPDMSVKKCSQVGLTEVQIRKFLAVLARNNGKAGIFSLPNEKMFTRIYNGRLKPIIDSDAIFNPDVGIKPVRSRDMVQIRNSFGYLTACTEGDATSISADFLMHDEVDLSPQEILALYQSRLQNSDMKITQKFSTPTFTGFGIDRAYAVTDQREYMIKCSCCNHWQTPRFEPKFVHIEDYRFDVQRFEDLAPEQINLLDLDSSYVRCESCSRRLDLGDWANREWVATFPGRTLFRGYQVRPFSTSRLPPQYIFRQLSKYQEDGFIRGFHNTVLGEPYSDEGAQIQRSDIEMCMKDPKIPTMSSGTACFLGIDVGFTCHITVSFDDDAGIPHFVLFDTVPILQLEQRIAELRKMYNIVQGVIDRFPYTTIADTLRETTGSLIMPAQYRGNAAVVAQKDELGMITHYSVNNTQLFERIHSAITNHKMVIEGYTSQKETVIAHLTDMKRDINRDTSEIFWQKNSGHDHYLHSMAFNMLGRRVCEHMFHAGGNSQQFSMAFGSMDWMGKVSDLTPDKGAKRVSRLGA